VHLKGKAKNPYEFGVKVSVATTLKEGIVVGMRTIPGNRLRPFYKGMIQIIY